MRLVVVQGTEAQTNGDPLQFLASMLGNEGFYNVQAIICGSETQQTFAISICRGKKSKNMSVVVESESAIPSQLDAKPFPVLIQECRESIVRRYQLNSFAIAMEETEAETVNVQSSNNSYVTNGTYYHIRFWSCKSAVSAPKGHTVVAIIA